MLKAELISLLVEEIKKDSSVFKELCIQIPMNIEVIAHYPTKNPNIGTLVVQWKETTMRFQGVDYFLKKDKPPHLRVAVKKGKKEENGKIENVLYPTFCFEDFSYSTILFNVIKVAAMKYLHEKNLSWRELPVSPKKKKFFKKKPFKKRKPEISPFQTSYQPYVPAGSYSTNPTQKPKKPMVFRDFPNSNTK